MSIISKSIAAFIISLLIFTPSTVESAEIVLDDFSNGLKPEWSHKSFVGQTTYELIKDQNRPCIKATSKGTSSGLYYKINFDPKDYPLISWTWKVDHVLKKGNVYNKDTDDYAARIYVVFSSFFFWNTRAINYIWANTLPAGDAVLSTYTDNSVMIAVESGPENTGIWREEKRNILEDYKKFFNSEPGEVNAIAIMTDTDNTGEEASACYGPIRVMSLDHLQ